MNANVLLLVVLVMIYVLGCEVNALLNSDGENEPRQPGARERQPSDNSDEPANSRSLLLPLQEGETFNYLVSYTQASKKNPGYVVAWHGAENWICTLARFDDSTFVFQTHFTGEKKIIHDGREQVDRISGVYASVSARIVNSRLGVIREEGDYLPPFWGDWLLAMKNNFLVSFASSETRKTVEVNGDDFSFSYTLDADKGLIRGSLSRNLEFDQIHIEYTME